MEPGLHFIAFSMRAILIAFLVSSLYLWARADPTLFYYGLVLAHVVGGLALFVWLLARLRGLWSTLGSWGRIGLLTLLAGGATGTTLTVVGNYRPYRNLLHAHEILATVGAVALLLTWKRPSGRAVHREALAAVAVAALIVGGAYSEPPSTYRVENPGAPVQMESEAMGGGEGPFFPSSIHTNTQGRIPSEFFMTSETCGQSACHPDSYREWQSSMHRFSSFNNQFYRKSIEYMQDVVGVEPSKWCAGCHDVAVLLNGMFDRPIEEIVHTPEAKVGLACNACHAMVQVRSTMGNGDYEIEYPPLHDLAASDNPVMAALHDFLVKMDPEPHRRTFLKPFHREQPGEFCSTCHKVHLDVPVNNYRWFRGFNEYDAWQASGVSHQGARSFYAPDSPMDCVDCHMPLRPTDEKGNIDGMGHSHRFAAANTAVPTANLDQEQIEAVREFIESRAVTVDIFAASLAPPIEGEGSGVTRPSRDGAASFFAAGEEEAFGGPAGAATDFAQTLAPLDRIEGPVLPRGGSVRLDVVVRTTGMGHMFPGGTVDSFDVWVELRGHRPDGSTVFWSGAVEDEGKGPVEKSAHFYRALLIDAAGNPIDKRNAWSARALVYARLIPPGAADVVHFRVDVPPDEAGPITFTAAVKYRKFSHFYTSFAYAGMRDPTDTDPDTTPHYDNGRFIVGDVPEDVSGQLKEIPEVPILTLAESSLTLAVGEETSVEPTIRLEADDKIRWNDYGIGLFLQGDLAGAAGAWERVSEIDGSYADGWVNRARAAIGEGSVDEAEGYLARAFSVSPGHPKAHYFQGLVEKSRGRYEEALAHVQKTLARFPRDRVVRNEAGRLLLQLRRYEEAVVELERTLAIDPEDLRAHYTLMLCYRALGRVEDAERAEALYRRFKADESSQALTGEYLRTHPEDNNERQRIHEHGSIPLVEARPDGDAAPGGVRPASS